MHCNLVKNGYQHTSKVLFSFVPNKQFGQLINISPHSLTMMNTVNTVPFCDFISRKQCKTIKVLGEGFKRSIYWNKYKVIPNKKYNANDHIRELFDSSYHVKGLLVLAYDNTNGITADSQDTFFQELK